MYRLHMITIMNVTTQDQGIYDRPGTKKIKIICIIILLKEFQIVYNNKCAIHECSQQINIMSMLRTTLYHAHFNDILTEYHALSTDTNDIENTNQGQYRENRQDILNAWQTDTPVKMPDNMQVLDNIEAYT